MKLIMDASLPDPLPEKSETKISLPEASIIAIPRVLDNVAGEAGERRKFIARTSERTGGVLTDHLIPLPMQDLLESRFPLAPPRSLVSNESPPEFIDWLTKVGIGLQF